MDEAWLIVGLGNPGRTYEHTRHNAGERAVVALASRLGVSLGPSKFRSLLGETRLPEGIALKLAFPTTYMNDSGHAVQPLMRFFKIDPPRLIVVHDELDLPLGALRLKRGGGTAGHHGLDSIVSALGTKDFYRVRIGVGKPGSAEQTIGWVLDKLPKAAREEMTAVESEAGEAALAIIRDGLDAAMATYNRRA